MRAIVLLLLVASISFSSVSDFSLDASLDRSGSADAMVEMEFSDAWRKEASICLSGEPYNIVAKDRSGLILDTSVSEGEGCTIISFTVPADFVSVRFSSDALTSKDGEDWAFDMIIRSSEDISVFSASLAMPPGSSLKSTNGAVSSSDGQLMVSWSAGDISTDERAHLRAGYALSEAEMDYLPYLVGALLLLVAIALAFFFLRKKPEPPAPRQEPPKTRKLEAMEGHAVFGMLDETDKEIVREIARQKGKTTQVHLQLYTHVPKATLSRRIASLENKGIIMRSRKGNRNLITLTDIFKKEG